MAAKSLDERFDDGQSVFNDFQLENANQPNLTLSVSRPALTEPSLPDQPRKCK